MLPNMLRVTPPRIRSCNRECPYPPITRRPILLSAAMHGSQGSGPLGKAQSGHAQGPRISLARRLSWVLVRGAPPFPDRPTAGRPAVNRSIQVRILVGEPIAPRSSSGKDTPALNRQTGVRISVAAPYAHVAQLDKAPGCGPGRCRFESCRVHHSCEQDSRFGLRARTPMIAPAEAILLDQRVGEPGRPCLPWKQEIGGSNPPTLTNLGNRQSAVGSRQSGHAEVRLPIADCPSEPLPSKQKTRVQFSLPAPTPPRRLAAEDAGPSNRMARVRIPPVAPMRCPFA